MDEESKQILLLTGIDFEILNKGDSVFIPREQLLDDKKYEDIQKIDRNNQYIFKDCVSYDKNGRKKDIGLINFGNPDWYPHDIFVVAFKQLPDDLNQYINKFGGKSRKSNRTRKSKRRRNRKSKKRR